MQYQNQGLSLSELICEGYKGLVKAAENFDETYCETNCSRFIFFAVSSIRQSINQALQEPTRIERPPLNINHSLLDVLVGLRPSID